MSISQEIESRINIVELAGKYLQIKKAGVNYKALCPFHSEKSPSFVISPAKNIAYCFACHHGGGPIKFLSEIEKIEYREAMQMLAKEAGVELKTDYYKERGSNAWDIYDIYKITAEHYHKTLFLDEHKSKLDYLLWRGLSLETIKKFSLGYSDDSRALFFKLKEKGFAEKDIMDSGIFVSPSKDKFYGRIIFPIANFTGNVVAFTGRVIDEGQPKYLNSPASRIFDKSSILYGLNLAKVEIGKLGHVIVVEGQMDTVALHQAGFTNTVGISGTALTKEHIHLLKRLTKKIYLCLDNDNAGIQATFASIENMYNEDLDIFVIPLSPFKDPDEILKAGDDFASRRDNAYSLIAYYIEEGSKKFDLTSVPGKKQLLKELIKTLRKIESKIEVDIHIREIAKRLDLSLDLIYNEYKNHREQRVVEPTFKKTSFDMYEIIAGHLSLYGFFDLFLEKFHYNLDSGDKIPSFLVIRQLIEHRDDYRESEAIDIDRIKGIELFIEQENETLNQKMIQEKFLWLVMKLNKDFFEQEKNTLLDQYDPSSKEYLEAYFRLLEKGKQIGIKVNKA